MSTTETVGLAVAVDDGPPEPAVEVPDAEDVADPDGDVDPGDDDEGGHGGSSPPVHPPMASVAPTTPHTAYRIRRPTLTPPQAEICTPNARKPT